MTTFILMAGSSSRWQRFNEHYDRLHLPKIKQFVDIYGMRLIDRTINQLNNLNIKPFISVQSEEVAKELNQKNTLIVGETLSPMHTIIKSEKLIYCSTFIIILLGDTVFSEDSLNVIFSEKDDEVTFFGNNYEIFASCFHRSFLKTVEATANKIGIRNKGKLRDLRWIHRFGKMPSLSLDEPQDRIEDENFIFISDWTRDIDHMLSLNRLMKDEDAKKELTNERR